MSTEGLPWPSRFQGQALQEIQWFAHGAMHSACAAPQHTTTLKLFKGPEENEGPTNGPRKFETVRIALKWCKRMRIVGVRVLVPAT